MGFCGDYSSVAEHLQSIYKALDFSSTALVVQAGVEVGSGAEGKWE